MWDFEMNFGKQDLREAMYYRYLHIQPVSLGKCYPLDRLEQSCVIAIAHIQIWSFKSDGWCHGRFNDSDRCWTVLSVRKSIKKKNVADDENISH